jgi:hypothetical protein
MEYILLIVYITQGQGWSVTTAEFADEAACQAGLEIAVRGFDELGRKFASGGSAGRAYCIPKHSATP